jgi:hypothetical protein
VAGSANSAEAVGGRCESGVQPVYSRDGPNFVGAAGFDHRLMRNAFDVSSTMHRRTFLGTAGAAATAGLAGSSGLGASSLDELRLASLPIFPNMQYFVMQREGCLDGIPTEVSPKSFPDGASLLQSFASGDFDIALFGVVPAMILMNEGVDAKLTAASNEDGMRILANEEFASSVRPVAKRPRCFESLPAW